MRHRRVQSRGERKGVLFAGPVSPSRRLQTLQISFADPNINGARVENAARATKILSSVRTRVTLGVSCRGTPPQRGRKVSGRNRHAGQPTWTTASSDRAYNGLISWKIIIIIIIMHFFILIRRHSLRPLGARRLSRWYLSQLLSS